MAESCRYTDSFLPRMWSGRRRTDYLRGLTLSSAYENLENYMM